MKYMILQQFNLLIHKVCTGDTLVLYIKYIEGGIYMLKFLSKIAEKYAKNTNTACWVWCIMHQPKMPASLVKKD